MTGALIRMDEIKGDSAAQMFDGILDSFKQTYPMNVILASFSALIISTIFGSILLRKILGYKSNSGGPILFYLWFMICSVIHIVIEGHLFRSDLSDGSILSSLWIEYGKSDWRYLSKDPSVYAVEKLTYYVVGPLCLLTALTYMRCARLGHILAISASIMQFYGLMTYFITGSTTKNLSVNDYYHKYYYLGSNMPWLIMPIVVVFYAGMRLAKCTKVHSNKKDS